MSITLTLRSVVGRLLSNEEVDDNFVALRDGCVQRTDPMQMEGPLTIKKNGARLVVDANDGLFGLSFLRSASPRWSFLGDGSAETGSNAGSNLTLNSFKDDGSLNSSVLNVSRATGVFSFAVRPKFGNATPWDNANLDPSVFLTSSALAPYLKSADAANTYAPINNPSFTGTVVAPVLNLTNALAVQYGGTGGKTANEARANLNAASLAGNNFTDSQSVNSDYATLVLNNKKLDASGYSRLGFYEDGVPRGGLYRTFANELVYTRWDATGAAVDNPFYVDVSGTFKLNKALPVGSGGTGQISNGASGQYLASQGAGQPMTWVDPVDQTVFKLKNRIINSECSRIDTPVQLRGVDGSYGPVNYRQNYSKGAFAMSQGSLTYNGRTYNTARCTCTALPGALGAGDYYTGSITVIEGTLCYDFNNNAFVAAGVINVSVPGNYAVTFRDTPTDSTVKGFTFLVNVAAANTPQFFSKLIPATNLTIPKSPAVRCVVTIAAVTGSTFQAPNTDVWYSGNFFSHASQTPWATAVNNFVEITLLHFEKGNKFTGFEIIPPQDNDRLCDRYSQRIDNLISAVALGRGAGSDIYRSSVGLRVPMRGTPIAQTNLANNNFSGTSAPNNDQWSYVQSFVAFVELAAPSAVQVSPSQTNCYLLSQHATPSGLRTADAIAIGANMYILVTAYL